MFEVGKSNVNENFLCQFDDIFLPTNLNETLNDIFRENIDETPSRQPVKFILTKQEPSLPLPQYLHKKTLKSSSSNSDEEKSNDGRWNKDEQVRFAEAVFLYSNDWKKIQEHVSSRNITQVRSHAQKFLMKLKESKLLQEKGLGQALSWTKTMNFLKNILSYNELKDILFSVEQTGHKKIGHKILKNIKKNSKEEIEDLEQENYSEINEPKKIRKFSFVHERRGATFLNLNDDDDCCYHRTKKKYKPEEDKEFLQKFLNCFSPTSGNITLSSSFDETSFNEESSKYIGYNPLNNSRIKYENEDILQ